MDVAGSYHGGELSPRRHLFASDLVIPALKQSFIMLRPDIQWRNPVMFVVEVGAALTLAFIVGAVIGTVPATFSLGYFFALDFWLWLTVLFANFATAFAEARGCSQAASLRRTRVAT